MASTGGGIRVWSSVRRDKGMNNVHVGGSMASKAGHGNVVKAALGFALLTSPRAKAGISNFKTANKRACNVATLAAAKFKVL